MTNPVDLTAKEDVPLWSCFRVIFPPSQPSKDGGKSDNPFQQFITRFQPGPPVESLEEPKQAPSEPLLITEFGTFLIMVFAMGLIARFQPSGIMTACN